MNVLATLLTVLTTLVIVSEGGEEATTSSEPFTFGAIDDGRTPFPQTNPTDDVKNLSNLSTFTDEPSIDPESLESSTKSSNINITRMVTETFHPAPTNREPKNDFIELTTLDSLLRATYVGTSTRAFDTTEGTRGNTTVYPTMIPSNWSKEALSTSTDENLTIDVTEEIPHPEQSLIESKAEDTEQAIMELTTVDPTRKQLTRVEPNAEIKEQPINELTTVDSTTEQSIMEPNSEGSTTEQPIMKLTTVDTTRKQLSIEPNTDVSTLNELTTVDSTSIQMTIEPNTDISTLDKLTAVDSNSIQMTIEPNKDVSTLDKLTTVDSNSIQMTIEPNKDISTLDKLTTVDSNSIQMTIEPNKDVSNIKELTTVESTKIQLTIIEPKTDVSTLNELTTVDPTTIQLTITIEPDSELASTTESTEQIRKSRTTTVPTQSESSESSNRTEDTKLSATVNPVFNPTSSSVIRAEQRRNSENSSQETAGDLALLTSTPVSDIDSSSSGTTEPAVIITKNVEPLIHPMSVQIAPTKGTTYPRPAKYPARPSAPPRYHSTRPYHLTFTRPPLGRPCTMRGRCKPRVDDECPPRQNGHRRVYLAHPADPNLFYLCNDGSAQLFSCNPGKWFQPLMAQCVDPKPFRNYFPRPVHYRHPTPLRYF